MGTIQTQTHLKTMRSAEEVMILIDSDEDDDNGHGGDSTHMLPPNTAVFASKARPDSIDTIRSKLRNAFSSIASELRATMASGF